MRYQPLPAALYAKNRARIAEQIPENCFAIFASNEVIPSNADGILGFKQNADLFYLTGIDQEDTFLILAPHHPDTTMQEILFVRETNDFLRIWEGEKLSIEEAAAISGIHQVLWSKKLEEYLKYLSTDGKEMIVNRNYPSISKDYFKSKNEIFAEEIGQKGFKISEFDLTPILTQARMVKSTEELIQVKKALDITKEGFKQIAKNIRPSIFEYQLEAELTYSFLKLGSRGHAFEPILASGSNACVLHYTHNEAILKPNELLLIDFGAEYGNYNADISRVLPVSGKFTPRQKQVYDAVLAIFYFAKDLMVPGQTFGGMNIEVAKKLHEELVKLGLIKKNDTINHAKKYLPHGVSHHLGLDVHDISDRSTAFKEGMLLTCEPGIYIPEEGIGIRIENDILINASGNTDLAADWPITSDEIEEFIYEQKSNN